MCNLVNLQGEIKAILNECTGTPTAKLIALLNAAGFSKAGELAALIGISERAIRKAKAELQFRNYSSDGTTVPELQDRAELQDRNHSSESGTTVPESALTRVEDNNKLTTLEDRPRNNIPPIGPPKSKRGSRLPDDWELPDDWQQWTLTNCPASTPAAVAVEALKFANYWQALSGAKAAKVDWRKTWQNWSLTAFGTAPVRPRSQAFGTQGSTLTSFLARRAANAGAVQ